ncbi:MAG: hypothetical protein JWO66_2855 [Candidatus Eremiobacteraeota bacterium]|nr:hypothetical protein [Candidatus Eremiobacteraeota bacterium]
MILNQTAKDSLKALASAADPASWRRRGRVRDRSFTIVSNDCWAAEVYKDLKLPYATPFVGTRIMGPEFIELVRDLPRALAGRLEPAPASRYAALVDREHREWKEYAVGLLDGRIELHFLHYATFAEAADKWRRRLDRIVWNRLFFKLSADKDGFTEEHLRAFDALDVPGKLAFVRRPYPGVRCAVVCGDDYDVDAVKFYRSSLRHFDLSGWLNGERLAG